MLPIIVIINVFLFAAVVTILSESMNSGIFRNQTNLLISYVTAGVAIIIDIVSLAIHLH